ncbi:DMT family transporter [Roseospira marina]|uniref:DMT family transporter n=2 Tax=Roseospira marina TaxID=140057 RepID=A0A5M6IAI3_9PROT|nr:DMT family transporter [Roseospira marina]
MGHRSPTHTDAHGTSDADTASAPAPSPSTPDPTPDTTPGATPTPALTGLLLVALAALLWSTAGIASRVLFDLSDIDPLTVGAWRLVLAAPLVGLLALRRPGAPLDRRDLGALLVLGLTQAGYQGLYFGAVARVGVALATLLALCAAPVLVALLARLVLGERLGPRTLAAVVLAVAGAVLLVGFPGPLEADGATVVLGLAMAGGSALSYAVFTLASRRLAPRHHPFRLVALGFGAGAVVLAAVTVAVNGGLALPTSAPAWGLVLYMGVVPTALAYVVFLWGMRRASATGSAVVVLLEPLSATLLAWMLFGERLGPLGAAGGALLLSAVLVLALRRRR